MEAIWFNCGCKKNTHNEQFKKSFALHTTDKIIIQNCIETYGIIILIFPNTCGCRKYIEELKNDSVIIRNGIDQYQIFNKNYFKKNDCDYFSSTGQFQMYKMNFDENVYTEVGIKDFLKQVKTGSFLKFRKIISENCIPPENRMYYSKFREILKDNFITLDNIWNLNRGEFYYIATVSGNGKSTKAAIK